MTAVLPESGDMNLELVRAITSIGESLKSAITSHQSIDKMRQDINELKIDMAKVLERHKAHDDSVVTQGKDHESRIRKLEFRLTIGLGALAAVQLLHQLGVLGK